MDHGDIVRQKNKLMQTKSQITGRITKFLILPAAAIAFCGMAAPVGAQAAQAPLSRPKIVIGLVVDQMRWDYLYRFRDRYGADGFNRLLRDGFSCESTYINYVPSVTAVGHSSIYTGTVPAIHGITGNSFIVRETGKSVYAVEDPDVQPVGGSGNKGRSPRNLMANTITDEVKLASNFRSKVIGIALKDRTAIIPAGHAADGAFWFDDTQGTWGSSTYYMEKLPEWVGKFNASGRAQELAAQPWTPLYPLETYRQSVPASNPYERPLDPGVSKDFPMDVSKMFKEPYGGLRRTPGGNTLTLDFARAAIEGEKLGQGDDMDFLTISLSTPDFAGHIFGPNSPKMEDMYLRLDRDIAAFLSWLDARFGKDGYLLFVTADHGAAHTASFLADHKIPAGVWPAKEITEELNAKLKEKYGVPGLILKVSKYNVYLDEELVAKHKIDAGALRAEIVEFLQKTEGMAFALDMDKIMEAVIPAIVKEKLVNGYFPERCGPIQLVLKPGWYISGEPLGTTHGLWNPYDTHIPLVWMGWGIKPGRTGRRVDMTDIAPTLAAILDIQQPNGCIGEPIPEVLDHSAFARP